MEDPMSRTFGEVAALRVVLTRMLEREALATGEHTAFLENELAMCQAAVRHANIVGDTKKQAEDIREEALATTDAIFRDLGIT